MSFSHFGSLCCARVLYTEVIPDIILTSKQQESPVFADVQKRAQKAGQAPGTAIYTGTQNKPTVLTCANFNEKECHVITAQKIADIFAAQKSDFVTWINVDGLADVASIKTIAEHFSIHPLTVEDILNVEKR